MRGRAAKEEEEEGLEPRSPAGGVPGYEEEGVPLREEEELLSLLVQFVGLSLSFLTGGALLF